jgi:pectinesterase
MRVYKVDAQVLEAGMRCVWVMAGVMAAALAAHAATKPTVAADGSGSYTTLQAAADALPETGGTITLAPGTYREKVTIKQANVRLIGLGKKPQDVLLVFDASSGSYGGTGRTATLTAIGDHFEMKNMTVQNDWGVRNPGFDPNHSEGGQAVALMLRGDMDIVEHSRMLGQQDTLYAGGDGHCVAQAPSWSPTRTANDASPPQRTKAFAGDPGSRGGGGSIAVTEKTPSLLNGGACRPVRQFFKDCYIEGHIDFIFGDANAVFQDCEIHAIRNPHEKDWLTAQSKDLPDRQSVYVFDHCRVTADEDIGRLYLGRPWRPYAAVVYLNTKLDAAIAPEGWDDWVHTPGSIKKAYFAEYKSEGRGAKTVGREPYSHQLTAAEAEKFVPAKVLAGTDGWRPVGVSESLR